MQAPAPDAAKGAATDPGGSLPDVDALLKSLLSQPGVLGALVYNDAAIPIKWTPGAFKSAAAPPSSAPAGAIPPAVVQMTAEMSDLVKSSRRVASKLLGGAEDELQMLRLRTRGNELIVTPSDACTMVVLQRARSQVTCGGGGGGGAAHA